MKGDVADVVGRLRLALPRRWFGDTAPVLDSLLAGLASGWAGLYALLNEVRQQSRMVTATEQFLDLAAADLAAADLFGGGLGKGMMISGRGSGGRCVGNGPLGPGWLMRWGRRAAWRGCSSRRGRPILGFMAGRGWRGAWRAAGDPWRCRWSAW